MRKYISVLLSVIFCFSGFSAFSQLKNYKRGLSSFEKGHYNIAIQEFLKVQDIEESFLGDLNQKIGDSYRLTNQWVESIPYYQKALAYSNPDPNTLFYLAYAHKAEGKYTEAKKLFNQYIDSNPNDKILNQRALKEMNSLLLVESIYQKESGKEFNNFSKLNTDGSEFTGAFYKGDLIFTASKKDKIYANGLPYLGLYKVKINNDISRVGAVELFSSDIFESDRNEGSPAFTPDGNTVVFARGNSGKRKDISANVDLYMSRFISGSGWTKPERLALSDSTSWDGSPAFSRDGRTLYFSSNRPGGNGGLDIYSVNMDASGRFGNPANMGKAINTPGDEVFPFVSGDGRLFFASDGHPGLGKLDIFMAVRKGGKITIENLGLPYNSPMDDFGLIIDENGNEFFSSNRGGGKGDDDIYYYLAPEEPEESLIADEPEPKDIKLVNYYLTGEVLSEGKVVDSASVSIFKMEGGLETAFSSVVSDKKGQFGPIKLDEDEDYSFLTEKNEFLSRRDEFTMYGRTIPEVLLTKPVTDTTFHIVIHLDNIFIGRTFRLENIYYDLDKFDIRPDAAVELDKLIRVLQDNPNIRIEIGSHTDARASEIYNLRLSQKRAEAAINYMVNKGIDKDRLEARGYGKSELLIENAQKEEEHQQNRRTEFKVIGIGNSDVYETEQL